MSYAAQVTISLAAMLLLGYIMTKVMALVKLPNVTAYIIAGILLGPYCLKVVPEAVVSGMDFLPDIALAFIAFSVGQFFELDLLKKNGIKVIIITVFESLMASIVIFIVTYFIMKIDIRFSLLLSALASATAPASTIMTIRQTHAKGDFVDTLLEVVALDDVVGLVTFSVAITVVLGQASSADSDLMTSVVIPLLKNIIALLLGGACGGALKYAIATKTSTDNRLIIAISILFSFVGVCSLMDVSPLLGCMAMGAVYINITNDDRLFKQLNYFSPPILLLFFVRSGIAFNLGGLFSSQSSVSGISLALISVVYFFCRIIGKYAGAFTGCLMTNKPAKTRNFLGLGLVPQAGVAIGLAAMAARILGPGIGEDMQTIIMSSSILYELIGPACGKLGLYLSGSYSNDLDEITQVIQIDEKGEQKSNVDVLIERIRQIQQEFPEHRPGYITPSEEAFNEAIDEQYEAYNRMLRNSHLRIFRKS